MLLTWELIDGLRRQPSAFGLKPTYDSVVAFLLGLDTGSHGGALQGFQQLVELKFGSPSAVGWPWLLAQVEPTLANDATEAERLDRLFATLEEYVAVDRGPMGRRRLFHEWVMMAQADDNRQPAMEQFGAWPEPASVSVDEAATRLGTDTAAVLALLRQRAIQHGRVGGEVRIVTESIDRYLADVSAEGDRDVDGVS